MALLTGDLAALVGTALDGIMLDGVLQRPVASSVDDHGSPLATYATHVFRGFDDEYSATYRAQAGIPETDALIQILAASCATTPQRDDRLVVRGKTYRVRSVTTDPARAVWACQSFEVSTG